MVVVVVEVMGMFRGSGVVGFLSATQSDVASTKAEVGR